MRRPGIVAFAFGAPRNIRPNRTIAKIASQRSRKFGALIYAQSGLNFDLELGVEHTRSKFMTTLQLARMAIFWAIESGVDELVAVAAQPHIWRCVRDLKYVVREEEIYASIKILSCEEVCVFPTAHWFDTRSTTRHTRSLPIWRGRVF